MHTIEIRMKAKKSKNNKEKKDTVVFVKPILSYKQITEIIDSRIAEIEKASEQEAIRKKKLNKKNQ